MVCIDAEETDSRQVQSIKPQIKVRYGRTVAEIYQGSSNVNLEMVKLGAAFADRKYQKQSESDAFHTAEVGAMNRKLRVWSPYQMDLIPRDCHRSHRSK